MVSSLLFLILHIFILEKGLVIKNTGSWYLVKTDEGKLIECKIKGNFRLKGIRSTNPIAVGDRVQINVNAEGTAFITEIEDRKNYIIRRSSNLSKQSHIIAANLDQCMLVVTVNYPETSTVFIDRFLASAEAYRVPVCLVFNKVDRYTEEELHLRYHEVYHRMRQVGEPCREQRQDRRLRIPCLRYTDREPCPHVPEDRSQQPFSVNVRLSLLL